MHSKFVVCSTRQDEVLLSCSCVVVPVVAASVTVCASVRDGSVCVICRTCFADLYSQFGQLPLQHRLLFLWNGHFLPLFLI